MADTTYLDSLFRAAFQEIERNANDLSTVENEFLSFYGKNYKQNETETNSANYNQLSASYRNIYEASIKGQIFIQNGRYNNEFICNEDEENELIGHGAYGEVFKKQHKYDEHIYAIKRQQKKRPDEFSSEQVNKLLRELKVNAVIKYDYLLQYKSFWFESDNRFAKLYIQMELCEMDLGKVVKLSENIVPNIIHLFTITQIFQEILIGVKYLHSFDPQIIHRDLKPANILLTNGENGRFVKIADFGFAVFHDTPQHSIVNSAADYTAPEVRTGTYDTRADIFSLGMVLAKISNFLAKTIKELKTDTERNLYNSKLSNMGLLKSKMIDNTAKNRPSCEQILKDKTWMLSETEVKNMDTFKSLMDNSHNPYIMNNSFFEYYTYEKLKSTHVMIQTPTIFNRIRNLLQ